MNYELALKLKEAGFPQDGALNRFLSNHADQDELHRMGATCGGCKWVYIPSLEELIEACGDTFSELTKMTHDKQPQKWTATTYSCEQCGIEKMSNGYGSTPEEAVANLWLELNKK